MMNRPTQLRRAKGLGALLLALVLFAGCGNDTSSTPTPVPAPATAILPLQPTLPPATAPPPVVVSTATSAPPTVAPTATAEVLAPAPTAPDTATALVAAAPTARPTRPAVVDTPAPATINVKTWPKYEGAWFDIRYPPGFTVRPGHTGDGSTAGVDSAFFRAPDGSVEFYVFSPLWSGDITEIELNPSTERVVEDTQKTKDSITEKGAVKQHWQTIAAKDGSYTRAYYDEFDTTLNVRHVFGIKFKDQATYNKYLNMYLAFKNSLVQYSD